MQKLCRKMVPWTNLKRKIPSIFLGTCVCLLILFVVNVFYDGHTELDSVDPSFASIGGIKGGAYRRHRKRLNNYDEEDFVCEMPKLHLEHDANADSFYKMPPLLCHHANLFSTSHGKLSVNRTTLGKRKIDKCVFRTIKWLSDDWYQIDESKTVSEEPFAIDAPGEFYKVLCYLADEKDVEKDDDDNLSVEQEKKKKEDENEKKEDQQDKHADDDEEAVPQPNPFGSVGLPDPDVSKETQHVKERRQKRSLEDDDNDAQEEVKEEEPQDDLEDDQPIKNDLENDQPIENAYDGQDDQYVDDSMFSPPDFEQFFAHVKPNPEVLKRISETRVHDGSLQMNVLIFALDSMSHLSYQRKLPETYKYLKNTLGSVVLNGYNIVGDATTAAMIPILTGMTELELPEVRKGHTGATYVDRFPFIWNKFEQNGYVTLYAEDQPSLGTFQLRFHGFEQEPVDHYIRSFWQAAHDSVLYQDSTRYCLGHQPLYKYTLDYLQSYFENYPKTPKFALGFLGEYSHHDNNPAEYIDADLKAFLENLFTSGQLNNTLLIVMGDHGARYSAVRHTIQGKLEERLPMMSLTFPKWFKNKYRDLHKNLELNVNRLTTPFDLHETLKDVLDIARATTPVDHHNRGISLLHEIPMNRTCKSAHIDMHWCTCMKYQEVDIKHEKVMKAAQLMVHDINSKTSQQRDLCKELQLKRIIDARIVIPNEKVLRYLKSSDKDNRMANFSQHIQLDLAYYQIILETKPNDGLFEGTVMYNLKTDTWTVTTEISRINMYQDQPHCILNTFPEIRKFCLCNKPKTGDEKTNHRHISNRIRSS